MPIVLIATTNPGKLREYAHLFETVPGVRVVSPNDVEIWVEVAETGDTLAENALLKARALYYALLEQTGQHDDGRWTMDDRGKDTGSTDPSSIVHRPSSAEGRVPRPLSAAGWWVLGDDSGLEVDAMGGAPGVHSNRWAGPNTTAADRNRLLLERLEGVPDEERTARFRCVVALISPTGEEYVTEGTVEGRIAHEPKGSGGFGYDPLFVLPDGRRMSELTPDEKNLLSHRGIAGAKAAAIIFAAPGLSG
ncbi:MAG: non-canonical purine NTP pyrophosphatase [Chloroflexia bacterium]